MACRDPQALFREGIDLFNAERYYDCHEVFEEIWTDSQAPDRRFLQALIHFAVGFHHHGRGNATGAVRQLRKGLKKISDYLPEWDGVRTGEIEREVRERLACIESKESFSRYPRIGQSSAWPGLRSPLKT